MAADSMTFMITSAVLEKISEYNRLFGDLEFSVNVFIDSPRFHLLCKETHPFSLYAPAHLSLNGANVYQIVSNEEFFDIHVIKHLTGE